MQWLKQLVADLPLRRPGFDPSLNHVKFVIRFSLPVTMSRCSVLDVIFVFLSSAGQAGEASRRRRTQRRPSGNREHWKEMLFPCIGFERSDEIITNYMNAKTHRQWEGTDKPGTVFQVPSLLFHIHRLHLWSFIAGKI